MRVAIYSPSVNAGDAVGRDVAGMGASLANDGHEVRLIAAHGSNSVDGVQHYRDIIPGYLRPQDVLIYHHCIYSAEWRNLLESRDYIKVLRYHNVTPPRYFRNISSWHESVTSAGRRQTRELVKLGFDLYLATSDYNRNELLEAGAPVEKCVTVPVFHRISTLLDVQPDVTVARHLQDDKLNMLNVGVIAPHKNHLGLLKAFAKLQRHFPESRLVIVGAVDPKFRILERNIRKLIAELGLEGSVVFTGRVTEAELAAYYRTSSLYVSASLHEGFCVPLVEAMAFGLPVVALARAAVPETLGNAGILVGRNCPASLAAAIANVISEPERQSGLIQSGTERYRERFSEKALCEQLQSVMGPIEELSRQRVSRRPGATITDSNVSSLVAEYIENIPRYPKRFSGRGIVICSGGFRYNTCAWVLIRMLRHLGCKLPIQVWYLGDEERDGQWGEFVAPYDVEYVDATKLRNAPWQPAGGWQLKSFAMLQSPFREVLLLDADNVPVANPEYLFDLPEYREKGAIFWPDGVRTPRESNRWRVFDVPYRDEPEQESGQILVNKELCWRPLNLCNWYNEHSEYFYQVVYGDKDTFRFAWHRLNLPFAMPARAFESIPCTLCQHDLDGNRVFQHRVHAKWTIAENRRIAGFQHEDTCIQFIAELRARWRPLEALAPDLCDADQSHMSRLANKQFQFVTVGRNRWPLRLGGDGFVQEGWSPDIFLWWLRGDTLNFAGSDGEITCRLKLSQHRTWQGRSMRNEKTLVQLVPTKHQAALGSAGSRTFSAQQSQTCS